MIEAGLGKFEEIVKLFLLDGNVRWFRISQARIAGVMGGFLNHAASADCDGINQRAHPYQTTGKAVGLRAVSSVQRGRHEVNLERYLKSDIGGLSSYGFDWQCSE